MKPKVGDVCRVRGYNKFDLSNPVGIITYVDKKCIQVCVGYRYNIRFVKEDLADNYEHHWVQGGPSVRTDNKNVRLVDLVKVAYTPHFERHFGMGFRSHYVKRNNKKVLVEFLPMVKEVNMWELDYLSEK